MAIGNLISIAYLIYKIIKKIYKKNIKKIKKTILNLSYIQIKKNIIFLKQEK